MSDPKSPPLHIKPVKLPLHLQVTVKAYGDTFCPSQDLVIEIVDEHEDPFTDFDITIYDHNVYEDEPGT